MNDASSRLQLNRTLLTASDLDRLTEEAVQFLQTELSARTITLFLYSKRGLLVPVASAGIVPPGANTEAYAPGEDLVGFCAAGRGDATFGERLVTRKALTETSVQFRGVFQAIITPDTEIAYVPLSGPNRTYGVLRCIAGQSSDGREIRFSQEDLNGLDVYAHQVGISISSLRRKVELDVLTLANELLADQPQNARRVYDLVTSTLVAESTEYAACSIRIRDGSDLVLESLSGASGMNMVDKERASRRPDIGFAAKAFSSKNPEIINDVQGRIGEFHDQHWLRANGIATAAIFPIFLDDDKIGILALYLWYPYAFYKTKLDFLENLCHQVATATRVVHLLTAREQLIKRMSAIVSYSGTTVELLQTILDSACDLTRASQGYISLISRRDAKLVPNVTTRHLAPDDIPPIDVNGKGLTALAVRNKASVRRGDVIADPDYVDFEGRAKGKTRSELVVPLLHEHVLGVIALQSEQIDDFSQTDQLLLETLAQYATLIFQRDRLYEGTKTLAEIDFSRANRERVMSVIAKSAMQLVDADAAILRTYSSETRELMLETYCPDTMNVAAVPTAMQRDIGACWDALKMKDVLKFDDLPNNNLFHSSEFVSINGFTDMVSVPLLLPGEDPESPTELGVINVFFRTPSPFFVDVERQLLRALGVSASYAIHDLSIIEKASRTHALAGITAHTTAAVELSNRLAHQALRPLREARLAMEAIGRAVRRQDPIGIPTPFAKLERNISKLESLIGQLAPSDRIVEHVDPIEALSDAFRLIHTNLFASSGRPHLNIGEPELWDEIKSVLRRVIKLVRLPLAAAYVSSYHDYTALRRVVATRGNNPPGVDTITLHSFDEFAWLADRTHVILPRDDGNFAWLDPRTVIGTPGAILYGHEATGGRLMIIVLGMEKDHELSFEDLATLYESIAVQIFTYIDNAMFGIELDFLTSETGHLMGRAIGKVESGNRILKQFRETPETAEPSLLGHAESAVENGLARLKLIHSNFYRFGAQRRFLDSSAGMPNDKDDADPFDVCTMLSDMLPMFRREAIDRGLKTTHFENRERTAVVNGPEDLLRLTFLNLYDNALKFAYANTFIDIRLFREDNSCMVVFENLGVGVAPDEVKTVFERRRRSRFQNPFKRIEGLGLGLAYCRRVVEEIFRGRIELVSRAAGSPKGPRFEGDNWLTTVTVTLPLMTPARRKGRRL